MTFNVQLTRKELKALAVFKPEFQKFLDDYDNSYNIYVHKLGEFFGLLKFLCYVDYKEHMNKLRIIRNLLEYYFFKEETKIFISDTQITNNSKYCKFISKIDSIYSVIVDILEHQSVSTEDVQDFFKEYEFELKELIK